MISFLRKNCPLFLSIFHIKMFFCLNKILVLTSVWGSILPGEINFCYDQCPTQNRRQKSLPSDIQWPPERSTQQIYTLLTVPLLIRSFFLKPLFMKATIRYYFINCNYKWNIFLVLEEPIVWRRSREWFFYKGFASTMQFWYILYGAFAHQNSTSHPFECLYLHTLAHFFPQEP